VGKFLNPSIWKRGRLSRASKKIRLTSSREIGKYIADHAGNPTTALLNVIVETDSNKFPEGRVSVCMIPISIIILVTVALLISIVYSLW